MSCDRQWRDKEQQLQKIKLYQQRIQGKVSQYCLIDRQSIQNEHKLHLCVLQADENKLFVSHCNSFSLALYITHTHTHTWNLFSSDIKQGSMIASCLFKDTTETWEVESNFKWRNISNIYQNIIKDSNRNVFLITGYLTVTVQNLKVSIIISSMPWTNGKLICIFSPLKHMSNSHLTFKCVCFGGP